MLSCLLVILMGVSQILTLQAPSRYLGLPLFVSKSRGKHLQFICRRVQDKLSGWKSHFLSRAGRTVLAQSVAAAIPAYALMSPAVPSNIL